MKLGTMILGICLVAGIATVDVQAAETPRAAALEFVEQCREDTGVFVSETEKPSGLTRDELKARLRKDYDAAQSILTLYPTGLPRRLEPKPGAEGPRSFQEWYETGRVCLKEVFQGNQLVSGEYYTPGGELLGKLEKGTGRRYQFSDSAPGQVIMTCDYEDGVKAGAEISYRDFKSDARQSESNYLAGKRHGPQITWDEQGRKIYSCEFTMGMMNGPEIHYFPSGRIRSRSLYANGRLNGLSEAFYSDGGLMASRLFEDDQMRKQEYLYSGGERMAVIMYERGEVRSGTSFRRDGTPQGSVVDGTGWLVFRDALDDMVQVFEWRLYRYAGGKVQRVVNLPVPVIDTQSPAPTAPARARLIIAAPHNMNLDLRAVALRWPGTDTPIAPAIPRDLSILKGGEWSVPIDLPASVPEDGIVRAILEMDVDGQPVSYDVTIPLTGVPRGTP